MKLRCFLFAIASVLLASASARGELFMLASGGQIEGTLVNVQENPREKYVIKTALGCEVTLLKEQDKEVVHKNLREIEYDKLRHQYPDTVEGQWALAEWCREHHL